MMKRNLLTALCALLYLLCHADTAPTLHIEGRDIVDSHGNHVVLHGVTDTPNPESNGGRWGSGADSDIRACIDYFDNLFTAITDTAQGARCTAFRLHLDPWWTNDPNIESDGKESGEADISRFSKSRLKTYMSTLYKKIVAKGINHGLHIVVRPPGTCPATISVGGEYQEYLKEVWDLVSRDSYIKKNAGQISFELANEPMQVVNADGKSTPEVMRDFFQPIVDVIRANGFTGIIWVPGNNRQSDCRAYEAYPVEGYNIGYSVHACVGLYGCDDDNVTGERLLKGMTDAVPVVRTNPVMVTEIDWSPATSGGGQNEQGGTQPNYGTLSTGTTSGWGQAFRDAKDQLGNVSMTLSGFGSLIDIDKYLATGTVEAAFADKMRADGIDPSQACGQACLDWYAEYARTDYARPDFTNLSFNTTTDNTKFINPVIASDFPDPDVARLGDTYYMLSTTMHLLPGATLIKSKDLVNWEYSCNPLEHLSSADKYSLIGGKHSYSQGMWAGAIEEHEGRLYILINGNDAGAYVLSTDDPEGKWDVKKLDRGYYDPGMIFEGDRIYIACGIGNISICELDKNWRFIKSTTVIRDKEGLEGSHLYHIGDYYYIYATYGGWPSGQAIFRSTTVAGKYEEKMLVEKFINGSPNTVHQGALIQIPESGEWWTMLMEDKGAIGRLPSLHPVTWEDGWPTLCDNGVPQLSYKRPACTWQRTITLPTDDNFRSYKLGLQWQWNHNPDPSKWSLFERPGYLRMYTSTVTEDMMMARGSLTQRIFAFHNLGSPYGLDTSRPSIGTVAIDVSNMAEGDRAGIAVQQDPYALIAVEKQTDGKYAILWQSGMLTNLTDFTPQSQRVSDIDIATTIYLRAQFVSGNAQATFYYSTDNKTWQQLGGVTTLRYNLSVFVGARWAIFNYATKSLGGFVDVDWFSTEDEYEESMFAPAEFEGFSADMLTMTQLDVPEGARNIEVMTGGARDLELTATYADGHSDNVSASAKYAITTPGVVSIANGRIRGIGQGVTEVTATYTDAMGNTKQAQFTVSSSYFPWAEEYITNIFSEGSYDADTRSIWPGQYGQMGWVYPNGIDISGYKYLVLKLDGRQTCGASLLLYTTESIWGDSYSAEIGDNTTKVIDLRDITYTGGDSAKGQPVDLTNVRMVAFWGDGTSAIDVADLYLTNNDDYSQGDDSGISDMLIDIPSTAGQGIYDLTGRRVAYPTQGVYIINGRKVFVK